MDRWQQISRTFHAALARDPRERGAFLAEACAGDEELRREVESLLRAHGATEGIPGVPGTEASAAVSAGTVTGPLIGRRLAHYVIAARLGAGGMGEVYRAHDDRLDRDVAIKLLPATSFGDPTARARLLREARAAAALNHPHICTIHEVGEADGQTYIAMELVEGQPLNVRLAGGALSGEETARYGLQLADALAHAHQRGVLHRDLKSANTILTPDARLKVLDFGLAKRLSSEALSAATTQSHALLTQPGEVMGTLAYMAPEQLRGQTADPRSDVWAFGVVLYEMATGMLPFQGQTGFELSASILSESPAPPASSAPLALQAVIARCLEKDPDRRYIDGGDVRAALEPVQRGSDVPWPVWQPRPAPGPSVPGRASPAGITRRRAIWLGGAAAVSAMSGAAAWRLWPRGAAVRTLAVLPFANVQDEEDVAYLCDGIAESLIRQLSGLPSLRVMPPSAVFGFRGPAVDPGSAGRQLGADAILAGALTLQSGRLLVTAELVDVASGLQLWSSRYDRAAADLLDIQDEIAGALVDEGLRVSLSTQERRQLVRHPTSDPEAYDLYLQARHLQRRATEDDYLDARGLVRRAVIRDPEFALAYVLLAGIHAMMVVDGFERPTDAWPQANRYLRQALELDPDLPEARVIVHAQAFFFDWDWEGAERERRLVMQSPVGVLDPDMLRSFALERWALGRPDEAVELARRSRELDPLSIGLAMLEADYLVHAGRLDAAIAVYERAIEVDEENPGPYFGLAEALYRQGRFDEAIEARRRAHARAGDAALEALFATARGEQGYREADRAWVRVQLEWLEARAPWGYVSPLDFARAYAQLGEAEQAFRSLEDAFIDRSPGLVFLNVDRAWDGLRADPRFLVAVRRVGLP